MRSDFTDPVPRHFQACYVHLCTAPHIETPGGIRFLDVLHVIECKAGGVISRRGVWTTSEPPMGDGHDQYCIDRYVALPADLEPYEITQHLPESKCRVWIVPARHYNLTNAEGN